ncbi:MAG: hypothetical protein JW888_02195, partial [Pirellulales bacterium]|nr:hypothetical protein [Pirellulales bacterium]
MRMLRFLVVGWCAMGGLWLLAARGVAGDSPPLATAKKGASRASPPTAPDTGSSDSSPARINRLIRQLGNDDYEARQEAQDALAKLGFAAFDALSEATEDDDLEIASRARYLLRLIRVDLTRPDDPPEVAALLAKFRFLEEHDQIARLRKLAALDHGRGIAALCRVIRFEPSIVLAKRAAVAIVKQYPSDEVPLKRLAAMLRENLKDSRRLPSEWMLS